MAREYRPSWDPCGEFGSKVNDSNSEFAANSRILKKEVERIPPPRVKSIAKALRKELPVIKATWKSFLPTLSTEDVRRYRVPHYEIVILELEEAGYDDAVQCMKMLFSLDEEMKIKAGPGTIIWNNPRLKDRGEFVDRLKIGLAEANRAKLGEQRIAQAAVLLETALYFQKTTWEWWWVAEQLFKSALNVSETIEDDYQTVTTIKYLYGRFLFNECKFAVDFVTEECLSEDKLDDLFATVKDVERSFKFLDEAREASRGKPWNATKILGIKQDSLFMECCTILYRALLSMARKAQENDAEVAVEACKNALKHAMDSGHDEYITDAMCELGRSYLRANQAKLALQNFVKYLNLSRRIADYEGICNAHMELAFAYKKLGDATNTMEHLELFRETASRFELPYKLAQAHYLIGEHLLSQNKLPQATLHLEFSFTLYNEMGHTVEAHQARCIAAVSKGQEFVDQFVDLILRCGKYDQTATLKLSDWKNSRVPFWRTVKDGDESYGESPSDSGHHVHPQHEDANITESECHPYSDYGTSTSSEIVAVQSLESSGDLAQDKTAEDEDQDERK